MSLLSSCSLFFQPADIPDVVTMDGGAGAAVADAIAADAIAADAIAADAIAADAVEIGDQTVNLVLSIMSGNDDAEQEDGLLVDLTSSDLELGLGDTNQTPQLTALRFRGFQIPAGATIENAYVQFTVDDEPTTGVNEIIVEAETALVPADFADGLRERLVTKSTVTWVAEDWTVAGESGPKQRTPDLAVVVQEVIDLTPLKPNQELVFILLGTGQRKAASFEFMPTGKGPVLHLSYRR